LRKSATFSEELGFHGIKPTIPMKTALISVLTATLLGFASLASGRPFDAADFISILFATGLVAWTIEQYSRAPRSLLKNRPIRLPISIRPRSASGTAQRLAA
jgi:hypothetical protein